MKINLILSCLVLLLLIGCTSQVNINNIDQPEKQEQEVNQDINIVKNTNQITDDLNSNTNPSWVDSNNIVFNSEIEGYTSIWKYNLKINKKDLLISESKHNAYISSGRAVCDGKLVFSADFNDPENLYFMYLENKTIVRLTFDIYKARDASWSPKCDYIVYTSNKEGHWQIYKMKFSNKEITRLTFDDEKETKPVWSLDQKILFERDEDIFEMKTTGKGDKPLIYGVSKEKNPSFSPDWKYVIYDSNYESNSEEIFVYNLENDERLKITSNDWYDSSAGFSPDGKYIAYESNRTGNLNIFLLNVYGLNITSAETNKLLRLNNAKSFVNVYKYTKDTEINTLSKFDVVIVEPYSLDRQVINQLKNRGVIVLAYIDIGEAENWRSYWNNLDQKLIISENKDWPGDYYVNVNDEQWHDVITGTEIPYILSLGDYDGLFLDMLDTVDIYPELKPGMIDLVRNIKTKYPDMLLVPNRGFSILEDVYGYVDGLEYEEPCSKYDFDKKDYIYTSNNEKDFIDSILYKKDMPVFALDHAVDLSMAKTCYEQAKKWKETTGFNVIWNANSVDEDIRLWNFEQP